MSCRPVDGECGIIFRSFIISATVSFAITALVIGILGVSGKLAMTPIGANLLLGLGVGIIAGMTTTYALKEIFCKNHDKESAIMSIISQTEV